RVAAVGVHRRHGWRGRLPARLLDGRLAPARVARRLRGLIRLAGRPPGPPGAPAGDPPRSRFVRVPGNVTPRAERWSLTLPAGSVVAIVGENGAGKTTLV